MGVVLPVTLSSKSILLIVVLMSRDMFPCLDSVCAVVVIVLCDLRLFDLRIGLHV